MRILRIFTLACIILFSYNTILAQTKTTTINEPEIVKKLITTKRSYNSSYTPNDKYKLQIFYGKNVEATENLNKFKRLFPGLDTTIIYTNPSYKVMAGNFKTKLEAEKNLKEVQQYFDQALIIKPSK